METDFQTFTALCAVFLAPFGLMVVAIFPFEAIVANERPLPFGVFMFLRVLPFASFSVGVGIIIWLYFAMRNAGILAAMRRVIDEAHDEYEGK